MNIRNNSLKIMAIGFGMIIIVLLLATVGANFSYGKYDGLIFLFSNIVFVVGIIAVLFDSNLI